MTPDIEIDKGSGFCFGVVNAITKAEEELQKGRPLYCLGDIVHNEQEVQRLSNLGLVTIDHKQLEQLSGVRVLIRAHGEPPSTYDIAKRNDITLIDASCPVVLKLQKRIKQAYDGRPTPDTQIVIYGHKGHAEVNGLVGQTDEKAIVVETLEDIDKLDLSKNIRLFSQTTKSLDDFNQLIETLNAKKLSSANFEYFDTICRQVSNRIPNMTEFAKKHDVIIFVSGKKSSNGLVLFEQSKKINPQSFFVSSTSELDVLDIDLSKRIGICGATSTPRWLMEAVEAKLRLLAESKMSTRI